MCSIAHRLVAPLLLAASSVLLAVLGLEVVLRVTDTQPDFFFQVDPAVGATHIPSKRGWYTFAEGRNFIEINSHGYRDRERSINKPRGTFRIAVLGDSFVEAFQVPLQDTFTSLMEERLNRDWKDHARYEVLNFGVSGFGTGQELETLRLRVLQFRPDVVLMYFYPSNDLFDNSRDLDLEPNRLHFEVNETDQLVRLDYEVADWPMKRWLRHHSKAYLFLRDRLKKIRNCNEITDSVHCLTGRIV